MPRPKSPHSKKNGKNFEFSDHVINALDHLVLWMPADSISEVARRCVMFVFRLSTELKPGDAVIIRKSDGSEKEIFIL